MLRFMRVLLQRVEHASVSVEDCLAGRIGRGYLLLLGVGEKDTQAQADRLAEKIVGLRLFNNEVGKFDQSLLQVQGEALVVSQFTLFADCRKGRRPSFTDAARPEQAEPLCDYFTKKLRDLGVTHVATGAFGAHMHVELCNDGPVTVWLDTATW